MKKETSKKATVKKKVTKKVTRKATPKKTTAKKKPTRKPRKPRKPTVKKGAPTKFDPSFCILLIEHMREGFSLESFPAVLYDKENMMVTRKTLYNWLKDHEEWAYAFDLASSCYMKYNENIMKLADQGERVSVPLVIFRLANKFPDKFRRTDKEDKVENDGNIKIETVYNPKKGD